jgi:hypothetical protein
MWSCVGVLQETAAACTPADNNDEGTRARAFWATRRKARESRNPLGAANQNHCRGARAGAARAHAQEQQIISAISGELARAFWAGGRVLLVSLMTPGRRRRASRRLCEGGRPRLPGRRLVGSGGRRRCCVARRPLACSGESAPDNSARVSHLAGALHERLIFARTSPNEPGASLLSAAHPPNPFGLSA